MSDLPEAVRRRFPDYLGLSLELHQGFVIGRLLEEGDRGDLAWLIATIGRPAVEEWWRHHGRRQLSHRSRAFWVRRLDGSAVAPELAQELWPLA